MKSRHKRSLVLLALLTISILAWAFLSRHEPNIDDIQQVVVNFRTGNVEHNRETLLRLSKSSNDLVKYYAINSMGDIGADGVLFLDYLATLLSSNDPFVRDAAAHSVLKLAPHGRIDHSFLVQVVYQYVNESAARFAVETLGEYGVSSPEILKCLQYAFEAKDSECLKASSIAYQKITGKKLNVHVPE